MLTFDQFAITWLRSSVLYPYLHLMPEWVHRLMGTLLARRYRRYCQVCEALRREGVRV